MPYTEVRNIQLDTPKFKEVQNIELDKPRTPGFAKRVETDIIERGQKFGEFVSRQDHPFLKSPEIAAVGIGQVAGGIGDIVGEGIVSGYQTFMPEEAQEDVKRILTDFSQTDAGKLGIKALQKGQKAFSKFEESYPDAAIALGSMLNIFGLNVGTKGAKLTAKELTDIGGDISNIAGRVLPVESEAVIKPIVRRGIEKSIRPSVVKGRTAAQADKFYDNATEAVKTIIDNKNNLNLTNLDGEIVQGLPTNLKQFSESISNTKKNIFKQYDEIARISGEQDATVNLKPIADELDVIINNRGMQATSPDIIRHAQDVKNNLLDIDNLSAKEAQDAIASLNNRLSSITDFNSAAKASVDSLVANKLRTSLNDVIEETTGKQYKELKRKYGALKDIERDVNRRAMVEARKNIRGLIDFTDVFTGAEVVSGLVAMQPSLVAKGLTGKAIASFTKAMNDPNTIVKNMFNDVQNVIEKQKEIGTKFKPKSKLLKTLVKEQ